MTVTTISPRARELQISIATLITGEETTDVVVAMMLVTAGMALMLQKTPEDARAWLHHMADDAAVQAEHNWPSRQQWLDFQSRMVSSVRA